MNEEKMIERKNPFCVISLAVNEYGQHNIQTSSAWAVNPYPETHIPVADELVEDIRKTKGFCDITLNEEGTEVVSFTAREIPEIPEDEPEPTPTGDESVWDELDKAYQEGVDSV